MTHEFSEAADRVAQRLFNTREGRTDPYPLYHQLRQQAPVLRSSIGSWLLTAYDDISASLRDPRFGKNYPAQMETNVGPDWREHVSLVRGLDSMLNLNPPDHTRLRRLVVKAFNKRAVDDLRPAIEKLADEALDAYVEAGGGDFLADVTFPFPVNVIGELLGVPAEDRPRFRDWIRDLVAVVEVNPGDAQLAAADEAQRHVRAYFDDLIADKRQHPDGKLISQLVAPEDPDDRLSDDEMATMANLLFAAGFETTTNLLGNGMWGFLQHPDQMARLRKEPERFEDLPDEILRYDGTAQLVARYTLDDVEVGGVTIPAGESVLALLGAGNHDPDEFPDPDALDLARGRFRPLSFGGGVHFCLGAQLARTEVEVVLRGLFERCDAIALRGDPPQFRDRLTLRGLIELPLDVTPAARRGSLRAAGSATTTAARPEGAGERAGERAGRRASELGARPRPGSDADGDWRNALRAHVESDTDRAEVWLRAVSKLADTVVLLARAELFRSCSADEIRELAGTAYPLSFEPGERLCVEGGESLECYVIEEGEAEVSIGGAPVARVGEGDVVGERGLLEDKVRSATVTAETHMVTYAISRQRLLDLVRRSPTAAEGMYAFIERRYADG